MKKLFNIINDEPFCSAWSRSMCGAGLVCAIKGHYLIGAGIILFHLGVILLASIYGK